jgi:hypothetical protein
MATGCNDKKSDDSLDIFLDEKSAENIHINIQKLQKIKHYRLKLLHIKGMKF